MIDPWIVLVIWFVVNFVVWPRYQNRTSEGQK